MSIEVSPDPNAFYDGGLPVETYDLFLGRDARMAGDVAFYLDLARAQDGDVLELAAGTGRVLLPLAQAGLRVTGLDMSQAMLDIAAARLAEVGLSARLICAPMQALNTGATYDLVLIPARAFQHLVDPAEQRATLRRIYEHLNPGGLLVIDVFAPLLEVCVGVPPVAPPREVIDPASGRRFRRTCLGRMADPFRQITGERLLIEELDTLGRVLAGQETSWMLRWSTRQEMAYLLELAGFDVEAQYGDFARGAPAYGREQIWVARRT